LLEAWDFFLPSLDFRPICRHAAILWEFFASQILPGKMHFREWETDVLAAVELGKFFG
jgi:hypothetical protein